MLQSELYDYNGAYIAVKETITGSEQLELDLLQKLFESKLCYRSK